LHNGYQYWLGRNNSIKLKNKIMARTIAQIQQSIKDAKTADPTLSGLTSTSMVSMWQLWTYIVAVCQWTLETLFDAHKNEVSDIIATQKPHTLQWYVVMSKKFQYGVTLPPDTDEYSIVPPPDPTVLVVQYAAAVELAGLVRIKVARIAGSVLAPLTGLQLTAFSAYMNRVKDAGVRLQLTSGPPDNLQLALNIFYDPLVLDSAGARLDGTSATPVKTAVNNFLEHLPFNGLFVLNFLIEALQAIDGVRIGHVSGAQAHYGFTSYVPIPVEYVPDAGYMALDEAYFDTHITYTAHGPV
jgi:hypothetical protein